MTSSSAYCRTMSLKAPGLMRFVSLATWKTSTEPSASSWRVRDDRAQNVAAVAPPTLEEKERRNSNCETQNPRSVGVLPGRRRSYSSCTTTGPSLAALSFTRLSSSKVLLTGPSGLGQRGARYRFTSRAKSSCENEKRSGRCFRCSFKDSFVGLYCATIHKRHTQRLQTGFRLPICRITKTLKLFSRGH